MFFESFILNLTIILALIIALTFDYVTKFFSYWYVRHVAYKTPIPFFGTDYHRVLGLRSNTEEIRQLYTRHSKQDMVGSIKSRIPDVTVRDPDLIKKVLSTAFENFQSRGLDLDKSRDVCIKNNLFYAEGEKWTLLRRGYESLLNDMSCVENGLENSLSGTNGDVIVQEVLSKVLDVIFKDLLIGDVKENLITDFRKAVQKRTLTDRLKSYLKSIFPSVYVLFGITSCPGDSTSKIMSSIKNSKLFNLSESIKQYEVNAKNKNIGRNTNELALSIFITFITEGYLPCLTLLTALFYELARNTDMQMEIRNSKEVILDAAIKETARLHSPYSVITRKCVKTYKFLGIKEDKCLIDKNVTVNIPVQAIHRDNLHYDEAKEFKPERFLNDDAMRTGYTFLPFGEGARKCVGEELAMQILRNVVRAVLKKYEVQITQKTPKQLTLVDHNFSRIVDRDIWLKFKPIEA